MSHTKPEQVRHTGAESISYPLEPVSAVGDGVGRELALAWSLLAVVGATVLGLEMPAERWIPWSLVLGLPLLLGFVLTLPHRSGTLVAARISELFALPTIPVAGLCMLALGVVGIAVFGLFGATVIATWVAAALLVACRLLSTTRVARLILGGLTSVVAITLAVAVTELILSRPSIARQVGSPIELRAWEDRYDGLWKENVLGFRTSHERIDRASRASRRILAIGDSFTWGDRIADSDDTWPAVLEVELGGPDSAEVINLGQNGYTTANEAELLRRLGWQFDPDLVVVQFYANDAFASGPNFESAGSEQRRLIPASFRRGVISQSAILTLLERTATGVGARGESGEDYLTRLYADSAVGWSQMRAALQEIGDSAARRQVPLVLLMFPHFERGSWTADSYRLRDVHSRVASVAADAGFEVVDLVPLFAAQGGDWSRWWATPYDGHPSVAAHRLVARELARLLRERIARL